MTKPTCDYCHKQFNPTKPDQRFCVGKNCRQKWHLENNQPGQVVGVRQVKRGGWNITIHYPSLPAVKIGSMVSVETGANSRQDASD